MEHEEMEEEREEVQEEDEEEDEEEEEEEEDEEEWEDESEEEDEIRLEESDELRYDARAGIFQRPEMTDIDRALEWSQHMISMGQIPRREMNKIVLEYLMISGYKDAAIEFSQEADLPADVTTMGDRENVRNLLVKGDVPGCLEFLNVSYPSVLNDSDLLFDLYRQQFVEMIVCSQGSEVHEAIQFAQEHILPLVLRDQALLQSVEKMMSLIAFSSAANISQIASQSDDIPEHLHHLRDATNVQRRYELASRVNKHMLQTCGHTCDAELPSILKGVAHHQQPYVQHRSASNSANIPILTHLG